MTQVEFNAWIRARFNLWTKSDVDAEIRKAVEQALAQRTWVGLEGEEIRNLWEEATKPDRSTMTMITSFARAIESKLKERNT
jgi:hypothetical protein